MGRTVCAGNRYIDASDGKYRKKSTYLAAGNLASAITGPIATCLFHLQMNGAAVSSGMGTCGLVGQIGVYTGWIADIEAGSKAAVTPMDWIGLVLISFILPGVLSWLFSVLFRKIGWIKDGDMKLDL